MPTINGTQGSDEIWGSQSADTISGLGGDDTLTGNGGNDTIYGGKGDDLIQGHGATVDSDKLFGEDGNDTLIVGMDGNDAVNGGSGSDILVINDAGATWNITNLTGPTANSSGGLNGSFGSIGNRTVTYTAVERFSIAAGHGNDRIVTGSGDDFVSLRDGDDFVNVGSGADNASGGVGMDGISADMSAATDWISWDLYLQHYQGPGGTGFHGFEYFGTVSTGSGNDSIDTADVARDEIINLGAGDDSSTVRLGHDRVNGQSGTDTLIVDYREATGAVRNQTGPTANGGGGFDGSFTGSTGRSVNYSSIERFNIFSGSGDDHLVLASGDDNATTGAGADTIHGRGGNDTLDGGEGNDILVGGAGADQLSGGAGNDNFILLDPADLEAGEAYQGGAGLDVLKLDFTDADEQVDLTATDLSGLEGMLATAGSARLTAAQLNALTAATGRFVLATPGAVSMNGVIATGPGASSFTLADGTNLFSLAGFAYGQAQVTGGSGADTITGSTGFDRLTGGGGDDVLNGGAAADSLEGGSGNDSFHVDHGADEVVEAVGGGSDRVFSSVGFSLAGQELEDLTLVGNAAIDGTGNDLANLLTGNAAANVLDGGGGADTMAGGTGNDTYVVDQAGDTVDEAPSAGIDTVKSAIAYTLAPDIENLVLTGTAAISGTGNGLANLLTGNDAANALDGGDGNDLLDGRGGTDTMTGGAGNDTYVLDNAADQMVEALSGGIDTVQTAMTFSLGAEFENLTLTGAAAVDGTGNGTANRIMGNVAANVLSGGDGDDVVQGGGGGDTLDGAGGNDDLDGGAGIDTMRGGDGNDIYGVDSALDKAIEVSSGGGTDEVRSSVSFTLGAHVERLVLTGTAAINATGNGLGNALFGNAGANVLDGGAGADSMNGAGGDDTYLVDNSADKLVESSAAGGIDTVNSALSFTLGANLENLRLTGASAIGGTGNGLDNILLGNAGANALDGGGGNDRLDGGAGADTMTGGGGDDVYVVDQAGDKAVESSAAGGIDTVLSSISLTLAANLERLTLTGSAANASGNALANLLTGNAAANRLDGGAGADTMAGGAGNDLYFVDDGGDKAVETSAAGGADTVESAVGFTLGAHVEDLILIGSAANGTGNGLANRLTGNAVANLLDGGGGADQMRGGAGNDVYVVDDAGDQAIETSSAGGIDQVRSAVDHQLTAHVENLLLTGSAATSGRGNDLANLLTGNSAANYLNGGGGADTMTGGGGDDRYLVADAGDQVIEAAGGGIDKVSSLISYTLGGDVEHLALIGLAAIDGTGNALGNTISGNGAGNRIAGGDGADRIRGGGSVDTLSGGAGDDRLYGGTGSDSLTGGGGRDGFHFDTAPGAANVDAIEDFSPLSDTILLDRDIFAGLAADGPLAAGAFRAGTAAVDADDRILYHAASGELRYDPDGAGGAAAILFAKVDPGTALTHADFVGYI